MSLSRNLVAGVLLNELLHISQQFQTSGLQPFLSEWLEVDACAGKAVLIHMAQEQIVGEAKGIDASGAILIETETGLRRFHSGEVSLRLQN